MKLTAARIDGNFVGNNKKLKCGPGSKPCGNSCIPKDHQCRASWNKPVTALKAGAVVAGVGLAATAILHPKANMRQAARGLGEPALHGGFALGNVARGNFAQAAKNVTNALTVAGNFGANSRTLARGYGEDLKGIKNRIKEKAFKFKNHRQAKKRKDSVWAEGFSPNYNF